ncbi:Tim10/DDP family zinc finger protein [Pilaira anomala]|nr:Tim10/DDP family zinc finger protein [Pilaira anomala]
MQTQQQAINPQNIALAEQELEMVTDLFNRITESCHQKCISKEYTTGDLNQGEAVCIDRCVAKFLDVNSKVGEKMQQMGGGAA